MKQRIAALAAFGLAAIALLAGCSAPSNVNGANTAANSGTSKSPDAQPSPSRAPIRASTPAEAFREYYEAIKKKDIAAVKSLFSKGTMTMMEEQAKRTNKDLDAVMTDGLEAANKDAPAGLPETKNEVIEGETATLEIKDGDKWATLHFIKEDGSWRLAFDKR